MRLKIIDFLVLMLYCGFIFWVSSRQTLPAPMWFEQQDKIYHAGAYGLMGVFAWRCFRHYIKAPIILALTSIALCSFYGASDEWHQSFVIGRDSSREDWLADTIGALIGVYLIARFKPQSAEESHALAMSDCAIDCVNCSFHDQNATDRSNSKP